MSNVPYASALGGRDAQVVIGETAARLNRIYGALTTEQIEARPAPGKWNLREVMAHLADCEVVWAWRMRYALEMERAAIQPFEQDAWAQMYAHYSVEEARAAFTALRQWNVAFVAGLSDAQRKKVYVHPERGEETLWTIVEIMAGHDLHHLALLEKVV